MSRSLLTQYCMRMDRSVTATNKHTEILVDKVEKIRCGRLLTAKMERQTVLHPLPCHVYRLNTQKT